MSLRLSEGEILNVLASIWNDARYRLAREHAHQQGHPAACDYITIAGQALQRENVARGGEWSDIGCNWRRAKVGDQSMDGLSVKNPADGRYYFEDVIGSAGTADAFVKYRHPFRHDALLREVESGPYAPHGYADPRVLKTHFQYDTAINPPPTSVCKFDLAGVESAVRALEQACSRLATEVGATRGSAEAARERAAAAETAAQEARDAAKHAADDLRALAGNGHPAAPIYRSDRLPVIGTITLRPQP